MDASKVAHNLLKEEYAALMRKMRKIEEKKEEDGELTKELCKPVSCDYNIEAINSFTVQRVNVPCSINKVDAPRDGDPKGQTGTNDRVRDKYPIFQR